MAILLDFPRLNIEEKGEEDDDWERVSCAAERERLHEAEEVNVPVAEIERPDQDLADFMLCWKVNLSFQTALDSSAASSEEQCTKCERYFVSSGYRSDFASRAVSCSAGHPVDRARIQDTSESRAIFSTCPECDQNFVYSIATRKQHCFREGCQRTLYVDVERVKSWMVPKGQHGLCEQFIHFVGKKNTFECIVCCEDTPFGDVQRPPTGECRHDPVECKDCLTSHLESTVQAGGWRDIRCPEVKCKARFSIDDIKHFANDKTLKLYNEHATRFRIETDPRYTRCCQETSDAGAKCDYGRIHPRSAKSPAWTCPKCHTLNCFLCKGKGHLGVTCVQQQGLDKTEQKDMAKLKTLAKRCPKQGCCKYIQWAERCPDMKCPDTEGCGTRFCFECKMIYGDASDDTSTHLKGCANGLQRGVRRREVERNSVTGRQYADKWDQDPEYTGPKWTGDYSWVEEEDDDD